MTREGSQAARWTATRRSRSAGSTAQAQQIGANGIPAWLLDRRLLVLGNQPEEAFEQAFAQLAS